MGGANYMGGKRNAVKARNKDTNGRIEKDHFMKKRYQILNSNLGTTSSKNKSQAIALEEIGFAHAKRDMECQQIRKKNVESLPLSSSSRGSLQTAREYSRTAVPFPKPSKLLETIDMNEPLSLRVTIDRILGIPDLLGLSPTSSLSNTDRHHGDRGHERSSESTHRQSQVSHDDRENEKRSARYPLSTNSSSGSSIVKLSRQAEEIERVSDSNAFEFTRNSAFRGNAYMTCLQSNNSFAVPLNDTLNDSGFSELCFESDYAKSSPLAAQYDRLQYSSPVYHEKLFGQSSSHASYNDSDVAEAHLSVHLSSPYCSSLSSGQKQKAEKAVEFFLHKVKSKDEHDLLSDSPQYITQSKDPWLALDEILDFHPPDLASSNQTPFLYPDNSQREGLGHKSKTGYVCYNDSFARRLDSISSLLQERTSQMSQSSAVSESSEGILSIVIGNHENSEESGMAESGRLVELSSSPPQVERTKIKPDILSSQVSLIESTFSDNDDGYLSPLLGSNVVIGARVLTPARDDNVVETSQAAPQYPYGIPEAAENNKSICVSEPRNKLHSLGDETGPNIFDSDDSDEEY